MLIAKFWFPSPQHVLDEKIKEARRHIYLSLQVLIEKHQPLWEAMISYWREPKALKAARDVQPNELLLVPFTLESNLKYNKPDANIGTAAPRSP